MEEQHDTKSAATNAEILTPAETARLLKVTERTIRNLVSRGLLRPIKLSERLVRFRRVDIDRSLASVTIG
jgi:excisionase family DNA binding protein